MNFIIEVIRQSFFEVLAFFSPCYNLSESVSETSTYIIKWLSNLIDFGVDSQQFLVFLWGKIIIDYFCYVLRCAIYLEGFSYPI